MNSASREGFLPDADKINIDINGERLLEGGRLSPPLLVVASEHLVREWDLLVIAGGQQTDLSISFNMCNFKVGM